MENSENVVNIRLYIMLASYLIVAIILFTIPIRRKIAAKKAGNLLVEIKKSPLIYGIAVYVLSLGLISILWIREFGTLMDLVLCGCGILGSEITTRDVCLYKKYGVYDKGVLFSGQFIAFEDILSLPVLQLPLEEQINYDKCTIVFVTKSKGKKSMSFKTEEEKDLVQNMILEYRSDLRP